MNVRTVEAQQTDMGMICATNTSASGDVLVMWSSSVPSRDGAPAGSLP